VMEFAEKFSKALEDSLFKDTKYYEIIKRWLNLKSLLEIY
jgi:hypothetical protein